MRFVLALFLMQLACSDSYSQTWHASSNGWPITITLALQGKTPIAYVSDADGACNEKLDNVSWDIETGHLEFRRSSGGITQWYKVTIADGLMIGRFCHIYASKAPRPTDPLAYKYHLTGWSEQYFAGSAAVFDIYANHYRGRLRVDRSGDGQFIGRLKNYAQDNTYLECPEEDIKVTEWDGESLTFSRGDQVYTGTVEGRYISGAFTHDGKKYAWSGRRAEVLTYGLAPKTAEERAAWQERTRRQLYRLMMAGNPAPLSVNVEILRENLPPVSASLYALRDDESDSHPQDYTLTELRLTYILPNWLGGDPIRREVHAYLARPNAAGPHPLVVALNGHMGSAHKVMDGSTLFWYGDAWARRGYMVLAVDMGHRPGFDVVRAGSVDDLTRFLGYADSAYPGDDPANGNGLRQSIKPGKPEGFTDADWAYYTDWEEEGERISDVMRAIDYATGREDVDPSKIIVTGLSMGGEVTSYVGALDPRVRVTIPAGYSPDLSAFKYLRVGSHCWHWSFADIREYIDDSDVLSLIAPRPLVVETGQQDLNYSFFPQNEQTMPPLTINSAPFASDKQVIRRARIAYGDGPLVHFFHPLAHEYRTGAMTHPVVICPKTSGDLTWQISAETETDGRTLFDYVAEWLGAN